MRRSFVSGLAKEIDELLIMPSILWNGGQDHQVVEQMSFIKEKSRLQAHMGRTPSDLERVWSRRAPLKFQFPEEIASLQASVDLWLWQRRNSVQEVWGAVARYGGQFSLFGKCYRWKICRLPSLDFKRLQKLVIRPGHSWWIEIRMIFPIGGSS